MTVAAAEPRTWTALCEGLGLAGLDLAATRVVSAKRPTRAAALIAAAFATQPAAHWVETLGPLGAAIGAVNRGAAVVSDPQVVARQSVVTVADTNVPATRSACTISTVHGRRATPRPPPRRGETPSRCLAEAGYSKAEITELADAGAVAT